MRKFTSKKHSFYKHDHSFNGACKQFEIITDGRYFQVLYYIDIDDFDVSYIPKPMSSISSEWGFLFFRSMKCLFIEIQKLL